MAAMSSRAPSRSPSSDALLDEPCAGLDPVSTAQIEDLILALRHDHTIIVATHSLERAVKISDYAAYFREGRLIEHGRTARLLSNPKEEATRAFIQGRELTFEPPGGGKSSEFKMK